MTYKKALYTVAHNSKHYFFSNDKLKIEIERMRKREMMVIQGLTTTFYQVIKQAIILAYDYLVAAY